MKKEPSITTQAMEFFLYGKDTKEELAARDYMGCTAAPQSCGYLKFYITNNQNMRLKYGSPCKLQQLVVLIKCDTDYVKFLRIGFPR